MALENSDKYIEENRISFYRNYVMLKRQVFGSIFSEKVFSIKKISNHCYNEAVRLILASSKGSSKQKTGQPFKNLELSGQVEVTGQISNQLFEDLKALASINR